MKHSFRTIAGVASLMAFAMSSHAQMPFQGGWARGANEYMEFFVSAKYLTGTKVQLHNLGEMGYVRDSSFAYTHLFNDGWINVLFPGSDRTSAFSFRFENAEANDDGFVESFSLSRYRSSSLGTGYEAEQDFVPGWEVGVRFPGWNPTPRMRIGLLAGLGVNALEEDYSATIEGELFRQNLSVPVQGSEITMATSGYYVGSPSSGPYILLADLNFDPSTEERVEQVLANGEVVKVPSSVTGSYGLDGILATVRGGFYMDYSITPRWVVQAGLGVSMTYLWSEFTSDQTLVSSTLASAYQLIDTIRSDDYLIGGYGQLQLSYRLNERTSLYTGAEFHAVTEPKSNKKEATYADIDIGSPLYYSVGVLIRY